MRKIVLVCLILGSLSILSMLFPKPVLAGVGVSPTALNFGSVTVSTISSSATIVVSNGGQQGISIVQVSSSLPEFIVSGPSLPLNLLPHSSVYFHVEFRPDAAATYSGTITFNTNSQNGNVRTVSVSGTGTSAAGPALSYLLSPSTSSLSFPGALIGTSSSQAVSLANTGTGNVTISQVSSTGTGFAVSGFKRTVTLSPGQSLSLIVGFTPTAATSATGSLTVLSSATNSPTIITLSGTGVQPQISVSPSTTSFSNAMVGSTSTQTCTISNPGTANLSITQATLTGTGFSLSGLTLPLTLPPGGTSAFSIKFAPAFAGSYPGTLTLVNNSPNSSYSVALSGTAVSPTLQLTASPTSLSFGSLTTGTSTTKSVTLTNTGNSGVTISQNTMSGSGFTVTGMGLPLTLSAGQSASFSVTFAPTATSSFSGNVTVTSTATNSPATITVTGTGVQPQISVIPPSIDFGKATVGSANTQSFTISNPGTANLSLSQAMLVGTGFSLSGLTLPLTLPPGGSSSFTVKFAPASAGSFSGNLTLVNNSPNSPFVAALSGTGISSTLLLTPSSTSLSFGSLTTGTSATQSVTLTNTGNSNVTISQNTVTGSGFTASGMGLPLILSAGQSTSFSVAFAPTTAGSFPGSVTLISTATNSPTLISLSGSATAPVAHNASLSWVAGSFPVSGFNIYRGSASGGPYTRINSGMVPTTAYTDSNVSTGLTYYYVATEVDNTGAESGYSNETAAVIP